MYLKLSSDKNRTLVMLRVMMFRSLDSPADQKSLDLKRQLQVVEQEATVLRTKITGLEAENEKLSAEKKKLELLRGTKKAAGATEQEKITELETKVANYEKQVL